MSGKKGPRQVTITGGKDNDKLRFEIIDVSMKVEAYYNDLRLMQLSNKQVRQLKDWLEFVTENQD